MSLVSRALLPFLTLSWRVADGAVDAVRSCLHRASFGRGA
jgi:hypothetical protein